MRSLSAGANNVRRGVEHTVSAGGGNYSENWIYCEFHDAENFKEYYDLNKDPFNRAPRPPFPDEVPHACAIKTLGPDNFVRDLVVLN